MKVICNTKHDYPDSIYSWINYDEFLDDKKNLVYVYAIFGGELPDGYKNKIYFNVEEPNGLYHSSKLFPERELSGRILNHDWTAILQMCYHSTEWLRNVLGYKQYQWVAHFPMFDFKYLPSANTEKIYDLMYQGNIHGYKREFSQCIDIMTKYKYVWTCISAEHDPRKTHILVQYPEKLKLMAQSKMTIIDNRLFEPYPGAFVSNITKLPQWNLNEAFSHIKEGIMPQFKIKATEHMLTRTLCLVKRNDWNVMELHGFEEGEHFLYYDDIYELKSLIDECLANWSNCEAIVENAFNKAKKENSSEAFYTQYLKPYDI